MILEIVTDTLTEPPPGAILDAFLALPLWEKILWTVGAIAFALIGTIAMAIIAGILEEQREAHFKREADDSKKLWDIDHPGGPDEP